MYDVILFGGTYEGRVIAEFLSERGINHIVCVATDYGEKLLNNENVRVGRMDADKMADFFEKEKPKIVVDATHPYAKEVTDNIKSACKCAYIRVLRDDADTDGKTFPDILSAVEYLKTTRGNVLITTGSKEIASFAPIADRSFARVLPTADAIKQCAEAGFHISRVICMQGPFSKELNSAMIKEFDIKYIVTKRSGKSGGFFEKLDAAAENNAECVIIDRPYDEDGVDVKTAEKMILELVK